MHIFWDVWSYLTSVDGAKFLSAIAAFVTILSGGYGFLKAYRYGERQIGYRLAEFLAKEEKRLAEARQTLGTLVRRPNPSQETELSVFSKSALNRALRGMGWGWWKTEVAVTAAASRCENQVALARRQVSVHEKEQALAHLLLGAIADASSDHEAAFAQFEKACLLDDGDVEALEYCGLQLLKLANYDGARKRFRKLATIAKNRGDNLLLARALRQEALANERLGNLKTANDALVSATKVIPSNTSPLEVAYLHEQHGRVRGDAGFDKANESLEHALRVFSELDNKEGRSGMDRIKEALKKLNERQRNADNNADVASGETS